jgi:tryptophan 2,3-dioxygenase
MLGRRDRRALDAYAADSAEHRAIAARWRGPSLFDSFVRYLDNQGFSAGPGRAGSRRHQPSSPRRPSRARFLAAYADDGEPAQVCERMIDLDEGVMEWR